MTPAQLDSLQQKLRANVAHNRRERGYEARYGPLVCQCPVPDADPKRDLGVCRNPGCKRKPAELLRRPVAS